MGALLAFNHSQTWSALVGYAVLAGGGAGLFVMAGATPAAVGLLADISEDFPGRRGAVMGLYSVFLAIGQIIGSLVAGAAAQWRGIDGMLIASFALLAIALLPLGQLRAVEHRLPTQDEAAPRPARATEPLS